MGTSGMNRKVAHALEVVRRLSREDQIALWEAMALSLETSSEQPPEWHRPLVRKALAEYRANPAGVRSAESVYAEIDAMLAKIRGE